MHIDKVACDAHERFVPWKLHFKTLVLLSILLNDPKQDFLTKCSHHFVVILKHAFRSKIRFLRRTQ